MKHWNTQTKTQSARRARSATTSRRRTSCAYIVFSSKQPFLHNAIAFGVKKDSELLPKLLMDGAWTRCLECTKSLGRSVGDCAGDVDVDATKAKAMDFAKAAEEHAEKLLCVVCKDSKPQSEFFQDTWNKKKRRLHIRCISCFQCPTCAPGTKHNLSDFLHGSKICVTCNKTLACVVCKEKRPSHDFSASVWNNQKHQVHHRCTACFVCARCPSNTKHVLTDFKFGSRFCNACDAITCAACGSSIATSTGNTK